MDSVGTILYRAAFVTLGAAALAPLAWAVLSLGLPSLRPDDILAWAVLEATLLCPPVALALVAVAAASFEAVRLEPPSWFWPNN